MRTPESGPPLAVPSSSELFDLLPIAIAELTADGSAKRCNRALRRLLRCGELVPGTRLDELGWTVPDEDDTAVVASLMAQADAEIPDPDPDAFDRTDTLDRLDTHDRPHVSAGPEGSADDGAPGRLMRLRHADGSELWVRATARRARTADPEVAFLVVLSDVTAEHVLSEELREQREHYRILADRSGDVALVHRGHEIVWASPSAGYVLGLDPRSLVGRTLADLGEPGEFAGLPEIPPAGSTLGLRLRLRHADGSFHWFHATVTARHPYGQPPTVYAWLRDIDEQVRAEQASIESEQRLRRAFEASPDGWVIFDVERLADGSIGTMRNVLVNARGRSSVNLPEEEIVGRELEEVLQLPEVVSWLREQVAVALAGGEVVSGRTSVQTRGSRHLFDSFVVGLDDRTVLCSWRDVTELVEAERLLSRAYEETAEMRATLQTALDATSDGFAVYQLEWDGAGALTGMRVVHANTAGAESLGLEADDLIDMEIHDFFPDVEGSGLWERIVVAATTKSPQYHRVHMFDPEGRWISAWDNTVAPVGEERMAITWRDVSKEEAAIRQLARTRDEAMYSATHDALTDLPNRVLLRQHLHEALRSCLPEERVGLIFVDLDRFKAINDTHGHAAGDVVLKETATRLGRIVRHGDLAARLAGDEFILVLTSLASDWSPEQFFARATALLSEPVWADGVELHPSASLGAVLADPRHESVDVDSLIKRADAAMYRAKAASRRA